MLEYLTVIPELDPGTWTAVFLSVFWLSGLGGFLYETVFYRINNGARTRRGNCFGPWISIYAFGGLMVFAACWNFRSRPGLVLLASGALCSLLEFSAGFILHRFFRIRLWDYSRELWNYGNIGGYICLRSVLIFAASGLLVFYGFVPLLLWLHTALKDGLFFILMITVSALCILDLVYNYFLAGLLGTVDASTFYKQTGWYSIVTDYRRPEPGKDSAA